MTLKPPRCSGFSLVEVTLAIGIVAFALIALLGILPVGLKVNKTSVDEIAAMGILSALEADLRTSPMSDPVTTFFKINRGLSTVQGIGESKIYLNAEGEPTTQAADKRYRLIVESMKPLPSDPPQSTPYSCRAKVVWPADARVREDGSGADTTQGSVEVYLAVYSL